MTAAAKSHSDTGAVLREAARRLDSSTRRLFLRRAIGLGTLTLLSGCDVVDGVSAEGMLSRMSDFNDRVQAWLFNPNRLAREYSEADITRPFPFNSFYVPNSPDKAPIIDRDQYRLKSDWIDRTPSRPDTCRAACSAACHPDHAPHLHRGLERYRKMERCPVFRVLAPHRCRHYS